MKKILVMLVGCFLLASCSASLGYKHTHAKNKEGAKVEKRCAKEFNISKSLFK